MFVDIRGAVVVAVAPASLSLSPPITSSCHQFDCQRALQQPLASKGIHGSREEKEEEEEVHCQKASTNTVDKLRRIRRTEKAAAATNAYADAASEIISLKNMHGEERERESVCVCLRRRRNNLCTDANPYNKYQKFATAPCVCVILFFWESPF